MVAVMADLCVPLSHVVLGALERIGSESVQPVIYNEFVSATPALGSGCMEPVKWLDASGHTDV